MDFIRQQLVLINERLAGLSPSQKMLTGALVVILIMTLLYWGHFASDQDTVALFPTPLKTDEMTKVTAALTAHGIAFTLDGAVVKVPADKQVEAMSAVTFSDALPANAADAFETMLEKISPLGTKGEFDARMKVARQSTLSEMLKLGDPSIRTAIFMITEGESGGLEKTDPRITVMVGTNGRGNRAQIAAAAFALAQNAVSGVERKDITVAIDGSPVSNGGLGEFASGDMLELKTKYQEEAAASIRGFYPFIRGIYVMVTADVDVQTKHEVSNSVDPLNKISMTVNTVATKTVSTESSPSGEPGVVPNVGGIDVRGANGPVTGSTTDHTEETNEVAFGKKQTDISTPAGMGHIIAASIRVPHNYFESAVRLKKKAEPTDAEVDAYASAEIERIRSEIKGKLPANATDASVTVSEYADVDELLTAHDSMQVATAGVGGNLALLATGHAKEVAVGVLALTSLFMVGRMVKKSAPLIAEPALALDGMPSLGGMVPMVSAVGTAMAGNGKKRGKGGNALDGSFDVAGDVMEGGPVMMGRELDEEVLETSQMVEQVAGFVKENPDTAAQLVKRWLNRA